MALGKFSHCPFITAVGLGDPVSELGIWRLHTRYQKLSAAGKKSCFSDEGTLPSLKLTPAPLFFRLSARIRRTRILTIGRILEQHRFGPGRCHSAAPSA